MPPILLIDDDVELCDLIAQEDVSEVLFCYSLGAYKTQSNSQANRVIS
jgi:hypothetical protein